MLTGKVSRPTKLKLFQLNLDCEFYYDTNNLPPLPITPNRLYRLARSLYGYDRAHLRMWI